MLAAYSNSNQTNSSEPKLGDMDNYNLYYEAFEFIKNLHENWILSKANILKQAEINKNYYDTKFNVKKNELKEGDFVRIKKPLT